MLAGKALGLTDALMVSGVGIVVVMALVSDQSGIPLENLYFKSIRCLAPAGLELEGVDENTVATIMAIISKESGIPLERLSFKSIKKVEE